MTLSTIALVRLRRSKMCRQFADIRLTTVSVTNVPTQKGICTAEIAEIAELMGRFARRKCPCGAPEDCVPTRSVGTRVADV